MTKNTNPESIQKSTRKYSSKTQNFVENAKKAVRNVLIGTGIMAESLGPVATTSSIPTTINSITAVSPAISTATKAITLGTATSLFNACVEKDNVIEDNIPPTINIPQSSLEITSGETLTIRGNKLYIGNQPIASRNDNISQNCTVKLLYNGKPISSGDSIDDDGTLSIKVSDEYGNEKNVSIKLTIQKESPTINISQNQINISGYDTIHIQNNQLLLGDNILASRNDKNLESCKTTLQFNGSDIKPGDSITSDGVLSLTITNQYGKSATANINIKITIDAPTISVNQSDINIFGGETINVNNNSLLIGDNIIASRNDKNIESCNVIIQFNGQEISSGSTINEAGTLSISITNKYGKNSNTEIHITNDIIYGIESLKGASMKVDQEINLLNGIAFPNGVELAKVEIELDGELSEINDPYHYTPIYPGACNIILTLKGNGNNTTQITIDNLSIAPLTYTSIKTNNIKPAEILPIVGQIESGDKKAYQHIEHLRIAEATRIRDMMRTYGAGNHRPEQYQELMNRLNTGMLLENPKGYDNYESIGGDFSEDPSNHAHDERDILNTLVNHANFKIINPKTSRVDILENLLNENPNTINIFGCSSYASVSKEKYLLRNNEKIKDLYRSKNILTFVAGSNINKINGLLKNKIYHESMEDDEHGVFGAPSRANGKNDTNTDIHLILTIGTDADGNIDQTNEIYESSRFPVGFHDDVLFAGRTFPHLRLITGRIEAGSGKYPTSYVNYTNVAIADLCFQMFAEVEDVDELLDMIRSSTDLRDHIKFNGVDQPLILMNPAGFFKKYLMPDNLPSSIESSEILELKKGYYKGVIFDIIGAEVNINGQWIPYNKQNESLIKNQNPMTLEWRLNGNLCRKLGYKGKTIEGKIIVVDDKWNGLNIDKDISINVQ